MFNVFDSKWLARLTFVATLLFTLSGLMETFNPKVSIILAGISGAISAFLTRVQPTLEN